MNAFNEIFGSYVENDTTLDEDYILLAKGARYSCITPKTTSKVVKEYVSKILWASIEYCSDSEDTNKVAILKSERTTEDEEKFINTLSSINYDNGFGAQELFGIIAFKDGTWLSRHEYDGSERWEFNEFPKEPDWSQY